jgi:hypothetical protein
LTDQDAQLTHIQGLFVSKTEGGHTPIRVVEAPLNSLGWETLVKELRAHQLSISIHQQVKLMSLISGMGCVAVTQFHSFEPLMPLSAS